MHITWVPRFMLIMIQSLLRLFKLIVKGFFFAIKSSRNLLIDEIFIKLSGDCRLETSFPVYMSSNVLCKALQES